MGVFYFVWQPATEYSGEGSGSFWQHHGSHLAASGPKLSFPQLLRVLARDCSQLSPSSGTVFCQRTVLPKVTPFPLGIPCLQIWVVRFKAPSAMPQVGQLCGAIFALELPGEPTEPSVTTVSRLNFSLCPIWLSLIPQKNCSQSTLQQTCMQSSVCVYFLKTSL